MLTDKIKTLEKRIVGCTKALGSILDSEKTDKNEKVLKLLACCSNSSDSLQLIYHYEKARKEQVLNILDNHGVCLVENQKTLEEIKNDVQIILQEDSKKLQIILGKLEKRKRNRKRNIFLIILICAALSWGINQIVNCYKQIRRDETFDNVRGKYETVLAEKVATMLGDYDDSKQITIETDFEIQYFNTDSGNGYYSCDDEMTIYIEYPNEFDDYSLRNQCQVAYDYYKLLQNSSCDREALEETGYSDFIQTDLFDRSYKGKMIFYGQADMKVYIRTNDYIYHYSHIDYNIPDYFCIEKNGRKNDFTEYYGDRFPQIDK